MLLVFGEYGTVVLTLFVVCVVTDGVNRQRKTSATKNMQPYSKVYNIVKFPGVFFVRGKVYNTTPVLNGLINVLYYHSNDEVR